MRIEEKFATFGSGGRAKNLTTRRLRRIGISVAAWSCLVLGGLCFYLAGNVSAQEVLPRPDPKFKGTIGRTYKDSTPDKIPLIKAPEGAPNVLFIMIDDAGFGNWSTFGGQIPTPDLDRLAQAGLRYTRFHTTALCSPTRAALLTGRNHHSAATGVITEIGNGYPGYTGQIPKSEAMVAELLRQNGYSTAFFGKNHNIPDWETSVSGPFDRWPTMQGFDHFYGFVGGEANQWAPALYEGNKPVEMEVPKGREKDYTLNENLADKAIEYIRQEKSVTPDRPFFIYFAPGATHAPHHVPQAWIAKFKGQFDQGWDKYREETYQRQLKMGIIPPATKLTPRPKEIPAWDSLTPDEKRVAARLMETFAAFTAQTDHEVGRVIDSIRDIGQLDNTLIMWEIGDNGASMEGTLKGVFNEMCVPQRPTGRYLVHHSAYRRNRRPAGLQPFPGWLGMGNEYSVPMGQTGCFAFRRHSQPPRRFLAQSNQRQGWHPVPVPPCHRCCANPPGSGWRYRTFDGQWCTAEAHRGREYDVFLRRPEGEGHAQDTVL